MLSARPTARDHLHGAWWPHTENIDQELTSLLQALTERRQVARGISLNREEWPGAPLIMSLPGASRLKIGWYGLTEPHLVIVHLVDQRRRNLLIVPPKTPGRVALAAMLMAVAPGNEQGTMALLGQAAATSAEDVDMSSHEQTCCSKH